MGFFTYKSQIIYKIDFHYILISIFLHIVSILFKLIFETLYFSFPHSQMQES
jgi:hypothetical protein